MLCLNFNMREENNKNLRLAGDNWSIIATAINVPSKDVAISFKIKGKWTQQEVSQFGKEIEAILDEWFEDSRLLDPKHFIRQVVVPGNYSTGKHSMQVIGHISCMTRKQIEMGTGPDGFKGLFMQELERLVDNLIL
jgi:hypothetical protein